ncbi:MAG: pyridoxal phosphate-dependent aminotransferase [Candidatus Hermodarchaeota archaeon]
MNIRLNMNEMYKIPPKEVLEPVKESINLINRYTPQRVVEILTEKLSNYADVPQETIFLSSGSDLLLKEFIFLFSNNRQIIIAEPTFIVINNSAQKAESNLIKIRLKEPDFKIHLDAIIDQLDKPSLIVLDNPNNPTGSMILTENDIETILEHENIILLIDEAYFEFSKVSYVKYIRNYSNLAVLRTLSKSFGLAGSGIGYLIGGEYIKKRFQGLEIMLPYPSVVAGIKALQNQYYMEEYVKEIESEKRRIRRKLSDLEIISYPSCTNFLLLKTKSRHITEKLAELGILVHDTTNQLGSEYCRVTIGSSEENTYFLEALEEIIKNSEN